jgi:hypothetical protein
MLSASNNSWTERIKMKAKVLMVVLVLLFAGNANANDIEALKEQVAALQEQINALAEQQTQQAAPEKSKLSIGGYGELHYNNIGDKKELDFHRFILYTGYEFSEKVRFFSELELEHSIAGDGQDGEIELEQAYIEFDLNKGLQSRAGIMLVPVGILNQTHEPDTFYGVERNPVEKHIIPTTWWGGGLSLHSDRAKPWAFDIMVAEGLKTSEKFDSDGNLIPTSPFSIRSGRQKTSKAEASDLSYTGRVRYTGFSNLVVSATARYESNLSQGEIPDVGSATLLESNLIYNKNDFTFKALYARWSINGSGAAAVSSDKQRGFYIEPSYKINDRVGVFARYNEWNNSTLGTELERQFDFGFNYWVHPNVVLKADYQRIGDHRNNKVDSGFNLGVGYSF